GAFTLQPLVPGTYVLDLVDGALADFGLTRVSTTAIAIDSTPPPTLELKMPSRQKLVDSVCAESDARSRSLPGQTALLLGVVLSQDGARRGDAAIRASWTDTAAPSTAAPLLLQGQADSLGRFQICGVPIRAPVRLSATSDSAVAADVTVAARQPGDVVL